jgi:hypothetical protein
LVRDFNPDVERFITRALRADRARRFQSAEQMADRLDAILVKLGQPSGPAALKRWLETLGARDRVLPPSELRDTPADVPAATMQLDIHELELQEVAKPEPSPYDDDDELSTLPKTTHARTGVVTLNDELTAAASRSEAALFAVASEQRKASARAKKGAEKSKLPDVIAQMQLTGASTLGSADVTMAASSDYGVALSWTGLPLTLETPAQKVEHIEDEDDTIEEPVAYAIAASRSQPTEPAQKVIQAERRPSRVGLARVVRTLKHAAIGGVVLPALLLGGLYTARPILPAWLAPPKLVEFVDGWLEEVRTRVDGFSERSTVSSPREGENARER